MNTSRKIGIICWAIVALLFTTILILGIIKGPNILDGFSVHFYNFMSDEEDAKVVTTRSVPIEDFEEININWNVGYVKFSEYDGNDVQLVERTYIKLNEDETMKYEIKNGVLSVESTKSYGWSFFCFGDIPKILEVKIPKNSIEKILRIFVNTASAEVYTNNVNFNEFNVCVASGDVSTENSEFINFKAQSTSGDVSLNDINVSGECIVSSTSGDLEVTEYNAKNINLNSTSGNIDIKNSVCGIFYAKSVSGDINSSCNSDDVTLMSTSGDIAVSGEISSITASSVSGEINIKSDKLPQALKANSTSGNIYLNIPENKVGFKADFSTVSGDFKSSLPLSDDGQKKIYGNGEYEYYFETVSGNLIIKNSSN